MHEHANQTDNSHSIDNDKITIMDVPKYTNETSEIEPDFGKTIPILEYNAVESLVEFRAEAVYEISSVNYSKCYASKVLEHEDFVQARAKMAAVKIEDDSWSMILARARLFPEDLFTDTFEVHNLEEVVDFHGSCFNAEVLELQLTQAARETCICTPGFEIYELETLSDPHNLEHGVVVDTLHVRELPGYDEDVTYLPPEETMSIRLIVVPREEQVVLTSSEPDFQSQRTLVRGRFREDFIETDQMTTEPIQDISQFDPSFANVDVVTMSHAMQTLRVQLWQFEYHPVHSINHEILRTACVVPEISISGAMEDILLNHRSCVSLQNCQFVHCVTEHKMLISLLEHLLRFEPISFIEHSTSSDIIKSLTCESPILSFVDCIDHVTHFSQLELLITPSISRSAIALSLSRPIEQVQFNQPEYLPDILDTSAFEHDDSIEAPFSITTCIEQVLNTSATIPSIQIIISLTETFLGNCFEEVEEYELEIVQPLFSLSAYETFYAKTILYSTEAYSSLIVCDLRDRLLCYAAQCLVSLADEAVELLAQEYHSLPALHYTNQRHHTPDTISKVLHSILALGVLTQENVPIHEVDELQDLDQEISLYDQDPLSPLVQVMVEGTSTEIPQNLTTYSHYTLNRAAGVIEYHISDFVLEEGIGLECGTCVHSIQDAYGHAYHVMYQEHEVQRNNVDISVPIILVTEESVTIEPVPRDDGGDDVLAQPQRQKEEPPPFAIHFGKFVLTVEDPSANPEKGVSHVDEVRAFKLNLGDDSRWSPPGDQGINHSDEILPVRGTESNQTFPDQSDSTGHQDGAHDIIGEKQVLAETQETSPCEASPGSGSPKNKSEKPVSDDNLEANDKELPHESKPEIPTITVEEIPQHENKNFAQEQSLPDQDEMVEDLAEVEIVPSLTDRGQHGGNESSLEESFVESMVYAIADEQEEVMLPEESVSLILEPTLFVCPAIETEYLELLEEASSLAVLNPVAELMREAFRKMKDGTIDIKQAYSRARDSRLPSYADSISGSGELEEALPLEIDTEEAQSASVDYATYLFESRIQPLEEDVFQDLGDMGTAPQTPSSPKDRVEWAQRLLERLMWSYEYPTISTTNHLEAVQEYEYHDFTCVQVRNELPIMALDIARNSSLVGFATPVIIETELRMKLQYTNIEQKEVSSEAMNESVIETLETQTLEQPHQVTIEESSEDDVKSQEMSQSARICDDRCILLDSSVCEPLYAMIELTEPLESTQEIAIENLEQLEMTRIETQGLDLSRSLTEPRSSGWDVIRERFHQGLHFSTNETLDSQLETADPLSPLDVRYMKGCDTLEAVFTRKMAAAFEEPTLHLSAVQFDDNDYVYVTRVNSILHDSSYQLQQPVQFVDELHADSLNEDLDSISVTHLTECSVSEEIPLDQFAENTIVNITAEDDNDYIYVTRVNFVHPDKTMVSPLKDEAQGNQEIHKAVIETIDLESISSMDEEEQSSAAVLTVGGATILPLVAETVIAPEAQIVKVADDNEYLYVTRKNFIPQQKTQEGKTNKLTQNIDSSTPVAEHGKMELCEELATLSPIPVVKPERLFEDDEPMPGTMGKSQDYEIVVTESMLLEKDGLKKALPVLQVHRPIVQNFLPVDEICWDETPELKEIPAVVSTSLVTKEEEGDAVTMATTNTLRPLLRAEVITLPDLFSSTEDIPGFLEGSPVPSDDDKGSQDEVKGSQGSLNEKGSQGSLDDKGSQGSLKSPDDKGSQGSQGSQDEKGSQGSQGSQDDKGSQESLNASLSDLVALLTNLAPKMSFMENQVSEEDILRELSDGGRVSPLEGVPVAHDDDFEPSFAVYEPVHIASPIEEGDNDDDYYDDDWEDLLIVNSDESDDDDDDEFDMSPLQKYTPLPELDPIEESMEEYEEEYVKPTRLSFSSGSDVAENILLRDYCIHVAEIQSDVDQSEELETLDPVLHDHIISTSSTHTCSGEKQINQVDPDIKHGMLLTPNLELGSASSSDLGVERGVGNGVPLEWENAMGQLTPVPLIASQVLLISDKTDSLVCRPATPKHTAQSHIITEDVRKLPARHAGPAPSSASESVEISEILESPATPIHTAQSLIITEDVRTRHACPAHFTESVKISEILERAPSVIEPLDPDHTGIDQSPIETSLIDNAEEIELGASDRQPSQIPSTTGEERGSNTTVDSHLPVTTQNTLNSNLQSVQVQDIIEAGITEEVVNIVGAIDTTHIGYSQVNTVLYASESTSVEPLETCIDLTECADHNLKDGTMAGNTYLVVSIQLCPEFDRIIEHEQLVVLDDRDNITPGDRSEICGDSKEIPPLHNAAATARDGHYTVDSVDYKDNSGMLSINNIPSQQQDITTCSDDHALSSPIKTHQVDESTSLNDEAPVNADSAYLSAGTGSSGDAPLHEAEEKLASPREQEQVLSMEDTVTETANNKDVLGKTCTLQTLHNCDTYEIPAGGATREVVVDERFYINNSGDVEEAVVIDNRDVHQAKKVAPLYEGFDLNYAAECTEPEMVYEVSQEIHAEESSEGEKSRNVSGGESSGFDVIDAEEVARARLYDVDEDDDAHTSGCDLSGLQHDDTGYTSMVTVAPSIGSPRSPRHLSEMSQSSGDILDLSYDDEQAFAMNGGRSQSTDNILDGISRRENPQASTPAGLSKSMDELADYDDDDDPPVSLSTQETRARMKRFQSADNVMDDPLYTSTSRDDLRHGARYGSVFFDSGISNSTASLDSMRRGPSRTDLVAPPGGPSSNYACMIDLLPHTGGEADRVVLLGSGVLAQNIAETVEDREQQPDIVTIQQTQLENATTTSTTIRDPEPIAQPNPTVNPPRHRRSPYTMVQVRVTNKDEIEKNLKENQGAAVEPRVLFPSPAEKPDDRWYTTSWLEDNANTIIEKPTYEEEPDDNQKHLATAAPELEALLAHSGEMNTDNIISENTLEIPPIVADSVQEVRELDHFNPTQQQVLVSSEQNQLSAPVIEDTHHEGTCEHVNEIPQVNSDSVHNSVQDSVNVSVHLEEELDGVQEKTGVVIVGSESGELLAPKENSESGELLAPKENSESGELLAPKENSESGELLAPKENSESGELLAPKENSESGELLAPKENSESGELLAPKENPESGELLAPKENPESGELLAPKENSESGELLAPKENSESGELLAPKENPESGELLAPKENPESGELLAPKENSESGELLAPKENSESGELLAPKENSESGELLAPKENSESGELLAPKENSESGELLAPKENPESGELLAPKENPESGELLAPKENPESGELLAPKENTLLDDVDTCEQVSDLPAITTDTLQVRVSEPAPLIDTPDSAPCPTPLIRASEGSVILEELPRDVNDNITMNNNDNAAGDYNNSDEAENENADTVAPCVPNTTLEESPDYDYVDNSALVSEVKLCYARDNYEYYHSEQPDIVTIQQTQLENATTTSTTIRDPEPIALPNPTANPPRHRRSPYTMVQVRVTNKDEIEKNLKENQGAAVEPRVLFPSPAEKPDDRWYTTSWLEDNANTIIEKPTYEEEPDDNQKHLATAAPELEALLAHSGEMNTDNIISENTLEIPPIVADNVQEVLELDYFPSQQQQVLVSSEQNQLSAPVIEDTPHEGTCEHVNEIPQVSSDSVHNSVQDSVNVGVHLEEELDGAQEKTGVVIVGSESGELLAPKENSESGELLAPKENSESGELLAPKENSESGELLAPKENPESGELLAPKENSESGELLAPKENPESGELLAPKENTLLDDVDSCEQVSDLPAITTDTLQVRVSEPAPLIDTPDSAPCPTPLIRASEGSVILEELPRDVNDNITMNNNDNAAGDYNNSDEAENENADTVAPCVPNTTLEESPDYDYVDNSALVSEVKLCYARDNYEYYHSELERVRDGIGMDPVRIQPLYFPVWPTFYSNESSNEVYKEDVGVFLEPPVVEQARQLCQSPLHVAETDIILAEEFVDDYQPSEVPSVPPTVPSTLPTPPLILRVAEICTIEWSIITAGETEPFDEFSEEMRKEISGSHVTFSMPHSKDVNFATVIEQPNYDEIATAQPETALEGTYVEPPSDDSMSETSDCSSVIGKWVLPEKEEISLHIAPVFELKTEEESAEYLPPVEEGEPEIDSCISLIVDRYEMFTNPCNTYIYTYDPVLHSMVRQRNPYQVFTHSLEDGDVYFSLERVSVDDLGPSVPEKDITTESMEQKPYEQPLYENLTPESVEEKSYEKLDKVVTPESMDELSGEKVLDKSLNPEKIDEKIDEKVLNESVNAKSLPENTVEKSHEKLLDESITQERLPENIDEKIHEKILHESITPESLPESLLENTDEKSNEKLIAESVTLKRSEAYYGKLLHVGVIEKVYREEVSDLFLERYEVNIPVSTVQESTQELLLLPERATPGDVRYVSSVEVHTMEQVLPGSPDNLTDDETLGERVTSSLEQVAKGSAASLSETPVKENLTSLQTKETDSQSPSETPVQENLTDSLTTAEKSQSETPVPLNMTDPQNSQSPSETLIEGDLTDLSDLSKLSNGETPIETHISSNTDSSGQVSGASSKSSLHLSTLFELQTEEETVTETPPLEEVQANVDYGISLIVDTYEMFSAPCFTYIFDPKSDSMVRYRNPFRVVTNSEENGNVYFTLERVQPEGVGQRESQRWQTADGSTRRLPMTYCVVPIPPAPSPLMPPKRPKRTKKSSKTNIGTASVSSSESNTTSQHEMYIPFKIIQPLEDQTAQAGSSATFVIDLSHINNVVRWFFSTDQSQSGSDSRPRPTELFPFDRYEMVDSERRHWLTVHGVSVSDQGVYSCQVGHLSSTASLTVYGKPTSTSTTTTTTTTTTDTTTNTETCTTRL